MGRARILADTDCVQIKGDVMVLATGFKKPEISFFQDELFPEGYEVRVFK